MDREGCNRVKLPEIPDEETLDNEFDDISEFIPKSEDFEDAP